MASLISVVSGSCDHRPTFRMPIYVNSGRCGSGKTTHVLQDIASRLCRVVFVTDRIEVMEERASSILAVSGRHGFKPVVRSVNSTIATKANGSVRQQIEAAGRDLAGEAHAVLLITHESMKVVDWSSFSDGWEIVIDEAPTMFAAGKHSTTGSLPFWRENFRLAPVGSTGWSRVTLADDAVSPAALDRDTYMADVAHFRRLVKSGTVYASLNDWSDAGASEWQWISVWNPLELARFERVTILAAGFEHTMTSILLRRFYGDMIEFRPIALRDDREWCRRSLTIRYFTDDPRGGSTSFWLGIGPRGLKTKKDEGKAVLRNIGAWLEKNSPADHIMMFNATLNNAVADIVGAHRVPGTVLSPRQAGTNRWSHVHCVTSVYSSKATPFERRLFESIGVTAEEVRRAREYEDILQFVYRSSLRDHTSSEPVEVRVYDRAQAEFLAEYFASSVDYVDVTIEPVEAAGVLTVERPRPGKRKDAEKMEADEYAAKLETKRQTKAEKQAAYRERLKAEKIATGEPVRRRGRPPGSKNKPKMAA